MSRPLCRLESESLFPLSRGSLPGLLPPAPRCPARRGPNWFFAQITPFDVHVKMGQFNTLVWITDFQTGEPVPGVSIEVRKDSYNDPGTNPEALTRAVTDANGIAELAGTSEIDPSLNWRKAIRTTVLKGFSLCAEKGPTWPWSR